MPVCVWHALHGQCICTHGTWFTHPGVPTSTPIVTASPHGSVSLSVGVHVSSQVKTSTPFGGFIHWNFIPFRDLISPFVYKIQLNPSRMTTHVFAGMNWCLIYTALCPTVNVLIYRQYETSQLILIPLFHKKPHPFSGCQVPLVILWKTPLSLDCLIHMHPEKSPFSGCFCQSLKRTRPVIQCIDK